MPGRPRASSLNRVAPDQQVADDQQRPPVAQHLEGAGDRAVLAVARHAPMMARRCRYGTIGGIAGPRPSRRMTTIETPPDTTTRPITDEEVVALAAESAASPPSTTPATTATPRS